MCLPTRRRKQLCASHELWQPFVEEGWLPQGVKGSKSVWLEQKVRGLLFEAHFSDNRNTLKEPFRYNRVRS